MPKCEALWILFARTKCKLHIIHNKNLSSCCDSRSYCVWRTVYWQTIKPVSVRSLRTAGTHDSIQRVEFIIWTHQNSIYSSVTIERDTPKFSSSRSSWITERNTNSARLIVCLKKLTFAFSSTHFVGAFCGSTTARPTAKVSEEQTGQIIGACLLGTPWYNF